MPTICAYLYFDGDCRDAMRFYAEGLGGELQLMEVGSSPMATNFPASEASKIMHAELRSGSFKLMASDMLGPYKLSKGNGIALMLECGSEDEIRGIFEALSKGGKIAQALAPQFWGAIHGSFTDKFGVEWMLNWEKPRAESA